MIQSDGVNTALVTILVNKYLAWLLSGGGLPVALFGVFRSYQNCSQRVVPAARPMVCKCSPLITPLLGAAHALCLEKHGADFLRKPVPVIQWYLTEKDNSYEEPMFGYDLLLLLLLQQQLIPSRLC